MDTIKLRGEMRREFTIDGVLACAWCGKPINGGFDPHHALIKSSVARHPAVDDDICNRVPLHRICHSEHGQSAEMAVKALDYLIKRLGAKRIARWYISLWSKHDLSVTRGLPPISPLVIDAHDWREYLELVLLPL